MKTPSQEPSRGGVFASPHSDLLHPVVITGVVAFFFRLWYVTVFSASPLFGEPFLDQKIYHELALLLQSGTELNADQLFRHPIYPMVLAWVYSLTGDVGVFPMLCLQSLAGIGSACFIAAAAVRTFKTWSAGYVAGLLMAFSSPLVVFESVRLATSISVFLVSASLYFLSRSSLLDQQVKKEGIVALLIAGFLLSLASSFRPHLLLLALAMPAFALLLKLRQPASVWKRLLPALLLIAGVGGGKFVTGMLESSVTKQGAVAESSLGINFYLGNHPEADGMYPAQSEEISGAKAGVDPILIYAREERARQQHPAASAPLSAYWLGKGLDSWKEHPGTMMALLGKKCWFIIWNREIPNNLNYQAWADLEAPMLKWWPVRWAALLLLAIPGIAFGWRKNRSATLLLVLCAAIYAAGVAGFFVAGRFRVILWPILCLMAGAVSFSKTEMKGTNAISAWANGIVLAGFSCINFIGSTDQGLAQHHFFRSVGALNSGQPNLAIEEALAAINRSPDIASYHAQLGLAFYEANMMTEAATAFNRSLRLNPDDAGVWNNLGQLFQDLDDAVNANEAYDKALMLAPTHLNALLGKSSLAMAGGRLSEAKEWLAQVPAEFHQDPTFRIYSMFADEAPDGTIREQLKALADLHGAASVNQLLRRCGKNDFVIPE